MDSTSILRLLFRIWRFTIPEEIKENLQRCSLYLWGFGYQLCGLLAFIGIFYYSWTAWTITHFVSPTLINSQSIYQTVSCSEVPLLNSGTYLVDEFSNWQSSNLYKPTSSLKQFSFKEYNEDFQGYQKSMKEINECIEKLNSELKSSPSALHLLLRLGFSECTSPGIQLTFPLDWSIILDTRNSSTFSVISNKTAVGNASFNGLTQTVGGRLNVYGAFPSLYGGIAYTVDVNFDSFARCLAENSQRIPPNQTKDLDVVYDDPARNIRLSVYINTLSPDMMAQTSMGCALWVQPVGFKEHMGILPNIGKPETFPSTREVVVLVAAGPPTYDLYCIVKLSFLGSLYGYINKNFYRLNNTTPNIISEVEISRSKLPFLLTNPGLFQCISKSRASIFTVIGSTISNTSTVLAAYITVLVFYLHRIKHKSPTEISYSHEGSIDVEAVEIKDQQNSVVA